MTTQHNTTINKLFFAILFALFVASCENPPSAFDEPETPAPQVPVSPTNPNPTDPILPNNTPDYIEVSTLSTYTVPKNNDGKTAYLIQYNPSSLTHTANECGSAILENQNASISNGNNASTSNASGNNASVESNYSVSRPFENFLNEFSFGGKSIDQLQWEERERIRKELFELSRKDPPVPAFTNSMSRSVVNENVVRSPLSVGDEKNFYAQGESKIFTLKAIGSTCRVWFCSDTTLVSSADLSFSNLATKFDTICEDEQKVFGSEIYPQDYLRYTNGNLYKDENGNLVPLWADPSGLVDILLFDIGGDAEETQTGGVFGYHFTADMRSQKYFDAYNSKQQTNDSKCFYIDSFFYKKYPNKILGTLAHEYQHMLGFIQKTVKNDVNHETWFTEMLSGLSEDIMASYFGETGPETGVHKSRVPLFNKSYKKGVTIWDNNQESYSAVFAFGSYLLRNYGGIKLIKEIACNQYVNEQAITKALETLGYNETFESVFLKYGQALLNTETNLPESALTFNRAVSEVIDGSTFSVGAIDLKKYGFKDATAHNANANGYVYGPLIYKSGTKVDLQARGFSIAFVGEVQEGTKINITQPTNSDIKMYLYFK